MSSLEQTLEHYADQRIESMIDGVAEFKRENKMTYKDLAELCEVSETSIYDTIACRRKGDASKLLKISMATGVPL